ncbi:MAG TPA: sugar phosphate isomerase/epimerase [Candidatus Dormibacteraeota bacterium]|nr:sugar phosphate isomerase/epimerase [Candidatus Dormibacteraeota bacterium]
MTTSTPRSLEVARDAGFEGIEARAERLVGDRDEVAATARAVHEGEVLSLNGVQIGLRPDGSLDREGLEVDLAPRLEICRAIGAAYLLAVPPRMPGMEEARALPGIRAGLALARDRAADAGIGLAFEFLGFFDCPIGDPAAAAAAVRDLPGVDLVIDSCHWHASGSGPLDAFPIERLSIVHLNDAPAKPPREIEDADRILPGLGVVRLADLARTLRARSYSGPWSLETFNPSYWEEDPLAVARRGAIALDRVLS